MTKLLRFALLMTLLLQGGCETRDALDEILDRGELVVVTRNGPTTYYLERNGAAGFEHALASRLAAELGVTLVMEPGFSLQEIFTALRRGEADIAAAGLTLTQSRAREFPHSIGYDTLTTQVVYKTGNYRPRKVADIEQMTIAVLANSGPANTLRALRRDALPELRWQEVAEADSMELLQLVHDEEVELALISSADFAVQQSLFPRLRVAIELEREQEMVWYLPPSRDNSRLIEVVNNFITALDASGELERMRETHFGHIEGVSRIGSHTFTRMMRTALPPYLDLIKDVAAEYQMEWELLAAIAYQESHWDPRAESPTGVRGMMMLTLPTAHEMGVDNRLNARQSLRGGARYYKNMKRRLPDDIEEPDRTWLALAAYNIGMGHLEDARVITQRQGGNPDLWSDVMERLPLLQKSAHYEKTRYGYARGQEAYTYVQNIRHYYSILQWQDLSEKRVLRPLQIEDYLPEVLQRVELKSL
ncbi:MAG: membrane-bound lytic murein transglycosylase MltF [Gammaproteobacteria bacterium]|nr:membrane-bound lytic murein transglycosylase MltF [Gammaproteobacteria bacterium]